MPIKRIVKNWTWIRDLNRYRKYVKYVCQHYKSDGKHSLVGIMRAVNKAQKRQLNSKEFCYFHYMDLTPAEQLRIVPWQEQMRFYTRVNSEKTGELLCNKFRTYENFREFYKREMFNIPSGQRDVEEGFVAFARRNGRVIIKPLSANRGYGVRVIDAEKMADEELKRLLKDYDEGAVAESLIVQSDALGVFHPQSVNTIRINTIRYDDEVEVKWPCLRTGRGGSVVDNAGAGGIIVAIDERTGVTLGAADEKGNAYTQHPDSGLSLLGFQIPRWDEACEMVMQLAKGIPDNRYTGWDLALTDKGWLLVEGNYMPIILWQIAAHKGIRPDFERMRKRILNS